MNSNSLIHNPWIYSAYSQGDAHIIDCHINDLLMIRSIRLGSQWPDAAQRVLF